VAFRPPITRSSAFSDQGDNDSSVKNIAPHSWLSDKLNLTRMFVSRIKSGKPEKKKGESVQENQIKYRLPKYPDAQGFLCIFNVLIRQIEGICL
jgi:hypothetical protein